MRRGYPTKRQYQRSLYHQPYLAQSVANTKAAQREWEPERVCGTCGRFFPTPELVPGGVCGSTGEIVASVWSRPCWQAKTVPTDPTNPAAVLRALVLRQPVEQTPEGLRVSNQPSALPDKCGGFVPTSNDSRSPTPDTNDTRSPETESAAPRTERGYNKEV